MNKLVQQKHCQETLDLSHNADTYVVAHTLLSLFVYLGEQ